MIKKGGQKTAIKMDEIRILERGVEMAEKRLAPYDTGMRLVEALIEARMRKARKEALKRSEDAAREPVADPEQSTMGF